jgi:hypothetical protein
MKGVGCVQQSRLRCTNNSAVTTCVEEVPAVVLLHGLHMPSTCTDVLGCCTAVLVQALSVLGSIAAHPHHFRHVLKSLLDR